MPLKPWYNVVTPREDLREGKPLDAAEFAVHLDRVRTETAPTVYQDPKLFFERTYLTRNLTGLAAEVIRRLSGETTQTSAVFNLATQFGGGKTHALTLLFHLARHGPKSLEWMGVRGLLKEAGIKAVPDANTAVFVGLDFDSLQGRGGQDGTPLRTTPWGEIAFQLGGAESFEIVRHHDENKQAPAGDVLRQLFVSDRPSLILMDEVMNYVNVNRHTGLGTQFYSFVHNLSEVARSERGLALVVSMPASNIEMSADDAEDYDRFDKMLDRLGKAVLVSAESETSEIVRRRLFEWDESLRGQDGRVMLTKDAVQTCKEYATWVQDHRTQLPQWFPIDNAQEAFRDTYPFHPALLSVFERKWQAIPRFQRTRGVLRLLALWVSRAYEQGYRRTHKDPLIGLGTAPLEDSMFRSALFEQLGENRLEIPVVTDVSGRKDSHSIRLDSEAVDTIRKSRLHQKAATAIFFESNGGQTRAEATVPEVRLDISEPGVDIGNAETVLDSLASNCYYLTVDRNTYRFGLKVNPNKLLADKIATIGDRLVQERIEEEVRAVFSKGRPGGELYLLPDNSGEIPNRPALTFVVLRPTSSMRDSSRTLDLVKSMTESHGTGKRRYSNALVWCVAASDSQLNEDARKVLAWTEIMEEQSRHAMDDEEVKQVAEALAKTKRDLTEDVWRAYRHVMLVGKDGNLRSVDLGLIHSSSADSILTVVTNRLKGDGDITDSLSPNFLARNWPGRNEWSTRDVLNDCFASSIFPRIMSQDVIQDAIAKGVSNGILAYGGKTAEGHYDPMYFETLLGPADIEISDEMFILAADEARKHIEPSRLEKLTISPERVTLRPAQRQVYAVTGYDQYDGQFPLETVTWVVSGGTIDDVGEYTPGEDVGTFTITATSDDLSASVEVRIVDKTVDDGPDPLDLETKIKWSGEVAPQKWMNFYTRILSKYANDEGLKLNVDFEVSTTEGVSEQFIEDAKVALRELGLDDNVRME